MVTDQQVRALWDWLSKEASLTLSAAKAGMDRKTARTYRHAERLPSQLRIEAGDRTYRTREDPFAEVWGEVEVLLEQGSGWEAKTLFEELQRRHPGRFADGQLRTLQRRVKHWRATRGPDKEVFFAQRHLPGRLGASDFTHLTDLGVTITGLPFEHLVYHFVLTHSNWEHVTLCFSESFASFSDGFQNAVWALGGVPADHRSDRMSLAVQASGSLFFTRRYQAVMAHYGVRPQAINAGHGHENGDAEQSHHRFKRALHQALLLRGSRDFPSQDAYGAFLRDLCARRNAARQERFAAETKHLRPLPARRLESFRRVRVRVQSGSTIAVERNTYSVPARLIGEWVEARVYAETISVWYGRRQEDVIPRLRGRAKHHINYRHVIEWLVRKPGAFAGYRYRAELFPTSRFRMAYDQLAATASGRSSREYLGILHLAARHSEVAVDEALRRLLDAGGGVSRAAVAALLPEGMASARAPEVHVEPINLLTYDELFESKEVWHDDGHDDGRATATGGLPEGTALAGDAGIVRRSGGPGPAGGAQLRELSAGTGEPGVRRAAAETGGAVAAGIAAAAGEEPGDVRPEAAAGEGGAAGPHAAGGGLRRPPGECAGVRETGFGEDASLGRSGPGVGAAGPAGVLQPVQPVGPGTAAGEAGIEAAAAAEAAGILRRDVRGRPGLRAAEPGGDGSPVHSAGGAVRARQRVADEQPAVLAMGTDLPRSDDDGGGDRPISASQRDRGVEPAELPRGTGEEGQGEARRGGDGGRITEGPLVGLLRSAGRRSAPPRSAPQPLQGKSAETPGRASGAGC